MELIKFENPVTSWEEANKLLALVSEKYTDLPVVVIDNDDQRATADIELRDLATVRKDLEKVLAALQAPAKAYTDKVKAQINPILSKLDAVKAQYNEPVKVYNRILTERAEKEAAKVAEAEKQRLLNQQLDAELLGFDTKAAILEKRAEEIVAKPKKNKALTSGSGTTRTRKWEVVDLSKVPAEFQKVVLDEEKIKAVRMNTDFDKPSPIPGIRFWYDESLAIKSWK